MSAPKISIAQFIRLYNAGLKYKDINREMGNPYRGIGSLMALAKRLNLSRERGRGRPISDHLSARDAEIVRQYHDGASMRSLAKAYSLCPQRIDQIVKRWPIE